MNVELNYNNWEQFFKELNFTYFRTAVIQKKYIETINKYAKTINECNKKNPQILEIAGGSGYTSALVADLTNKYDAKVYFSDIDTTIVNLVKSKFYYSKNLEFLDLDSGNIDLDDDFVDIIFHQGFFEHFEDEEIIKFLKEQARVAKHYVIFDIPNSRRNDKTQEYGNERFLSNKKWNKLVNESGLVTKEIFGRRFNNYWKKFVPIKLIESDWFGKYFGESSIFVCGKF